MKTSGTQIEIENRLREKRQALALSQKQLADLAGITRQAVSALEANQYSPATSVALQLARALRCRVEDLFNIKQGGETIEGELLGNLSHKQQTGARSGDASRPPPARASASWTRGTRQSRRYSRRSYRRGKPEKTQVKVKLLKDREVVRRKIVVGGCDPAMYLAGEHVQNTIKRTSCHG